MILTEYFWKFQWKITLWECCWHTLFTVLQIYRERFVAWKPLEFSFWSYVNLVCLTLRILTITHKTEWKLVCSPKIGYVVHVDNMQSHDAIWNDVIPRITQSNNIFYVFVDGVCQGILRWCIMGYLLTCSIAFGTILTLLRESYSGSLIMLIVSGSCRNLWHEKTTIMIKRDTSAGYIIMIHQWS